MSRNVALIDIRGSTADLDQKLTRARDSLGRFAKQGAQEVAGLTAALQATDRTVLTLSASFQRLTSAAQALSRTSRGTAENAAAAKEWAAALQAAERAMERVNSTAERARRSGGGFGSGFSQSFATPFGLGGISRAAGVGGAAGFVAGLAADQAISFGGGTLDAARAAGDAQRFLATAARRAGVSYGTVAEDAEAFAREIGISTTEAQRVTAQALRLSSTAGRPQDAGRLSRSLTDALVSAGYGPGELDTAFTQLTTGQDELGDKLGLGNPSDWYERWAQAAGRTAGSLSEIEKLQIRINTVTAEGERVQGAAAERAESAIGKWDAFLKRLEDLRVEFANKVFTDPAALLEEGISGGVRPSGGPLQNGYSYDPGARAAPIVGPGFTDPLKYLEANAFEIYEYERTGRHPFDEGFVKRLEAVKKAAKALKEERALTEGLLGDTASAKERREFYGERGYDYPLQGIEDQYQSRLRAIRQRFLDPETGIFKVTPEAAKALNANEDLRAEQRADALQRIQVESRREVQRLAISLQGAQGNPYAAIFQQAEEALRSFQERYGPFSREFTQAQKLVTANRDEQVRRVARGQALEYGTLFLGLAGRTDALSTVGANPYLGLYVDEAVERDKFQESLRGVVDPARRAALTREYEARRGELTATSERRIGEQIALRTADITRQQAIIAGRPYDADRQLLLSAFGEVPNEAALAAVYQQALADPAFRERLTGGQKQELIAYGERQITDLGKQQADALAEIAQFLKDLKASTNILPEDIEKFIKTGMVVLVKDQSSSTESTLERGSSNYGPYGNG
jgi:hypothetical protein